MSKLNFDIKRFFKTSFQDSKFERSFENVPIEAHPLYAVTEIGKFFSAANG